MVAVTTTLDKYIWTPAGKLRVAAAITATLTYNQRHGLRPSTLRQMARIVGHPNHTSIQRYAAGNTDKPNREHCKILRDIAPFIYRVAGFQLLPNSRQIDQVVHVNLPNPDSLDVAYWENPDLLSITYGGEGWREFVRLGTHDGKQLEMPSIAASSSSPGALLWDLFLKLPEKPRHKIGDILGVPATTIQALVGESSAVLDKEQINSLSEIVQDFLIRRTGQKPDVWDLQRLAQAFPPESDLHNLDILQAIADDRLAITEIQAVRLAKLMTDYGVHWSNQDLRERDSRSGRQLTISDAVQTHEHDHEANGANCH